MNSLPRKNTPAGHVPPYDAYEAKYAAPQQPIPAAFIGVQCRSGSAEACMAGLERLFRLPTGPARVPPTRLDTLLASDTEYHGIARLSERVEKTWYHGYWGGSRDRILDSAQDPLVNNGLPGASEQPPGGYGQIVSVVMPPNVCVARGGPNWSAATGREREIFLDRVYPAFLEGARYLREHPDEAGCCSACLVQETDAAGEPIERVNLHAYFETLADLERWTRQHPTHLEIFHRYLAMVGELGELPAINLYHEVSVIPEGALTGTYVNCDPATGFMRFGTGTADRNTNKESDRVKTSTT